MNIISNAVLTVKEILLFLKLSNVILFKSLLTIFTSSENLESMPFDRTSTELFFEIIHWTHMDFFRCSAHRTDKVMVMADFP